MKKRTRTKNRRKKLLLGLGGAPKLYQMHGTVGGGGSNAYANNTLPPGAEGAQAYILKEGNQGLIDAAQQNFEAKSLEAEHDLAQTAEELQGESLQGVNTAKAIIGKGTDIANKLRDNTGNDLLKKDKGIGSIIKGGIHAGRSFKAGKGYLEATKGLQDTIQASKNLVSTSQSMRNLSSGLPANFGKGIGNMDKIGSGLGQGKFSMFNQAKGATSTGLQIQPGTLTNIAEQATGGAKTAVGAGLKNVGTAWKGMSTLGKQSLIGAGLSAAGKGVSKLSDDQKDTTLRGGEAVGSMLEGAGKGVGLAATVGTLGTALGATAATNFWNPIGWAAGIAGAGLALRSALKKRKTARKAERDAYKKKAKASMGVRQAEIASKTYSGGDQGQVMVQRLGGPTKFRTRGVYKNKRRAPKVISDIKKFNYRFGGTPWTKGPRSTSDLQKQILV